MALCPNLGSLWIIDDGDANPYFFSGTFTINPSADRNPPGGGQIWRGTLELTAVKVVNKKK